MSGTYRGRRSYKQQSSPPDAMEPELRDDTGLENYLSAPSFVPAFKSPEFKVEADEFVPGKYSTQQTPSSWITPETLKNSFLKPLEQTQKEELKEVQEKVVQELREETSDSFSKQSSQEEGSEFRSSSENVSIQKAEEIFIRTPVVPQKNPVKSQETHKKTYTLKEILEIEEDHESYIKPLEVVKIERRKFCMKTEPKYKYTKTAISEETKTAWRQEVPEHLKIIQEQAAVKTQKLKQEKSREEKVSRQIKITLNKLTPTNFERLKEQLLEIAKEDTNNLKLLAEGVFHKACMEVRYTNLYAKLCEFIFLEYQKFQFSQEQLQALSSSQLKSNNFFRREILSMCQEVFESKTTQPPESLSEEDSEILRIQEKKKVIGNVRLIGELFKVNLIPAKIVLICIRELINPELESFPKTIEVNQKYLNEDKLEGAVTLLKTGGRMFEKEAVVKKTHIIMLMLKKIIEEKLVSKRIQFLIMNVLDAREAGWPEAVEQPTTIENIHENS